jgi:hypothetical protein
LDLYLLSKKWKELVEKARAKQLQPQEYNSGFYYLSFLFYFLSLSVSAEGLGFVLKIFLE